MNPDYSFHWKVYEIDCQSSYAVGAHKTSLRGKRSSQCLVGKRRQLLKEDRPPFVTVLKHKAISLTAPPLAA